MVRRAAAVGRNTLQVEGVEAAPGAGRSGAADRRPAGYTLNVDPGSVDALEVLRLAESARAGRPDRDHALAMFSGEVLPGAGDGAWIEPYRARLEETRLG